MHTFDSQKSEEIVECKDMTRMQNSRNTNEQINFNIYWPNILKFVPKFFSNIYRPKVNFVNIPDMILELYTCLIETDTDFHFLPVMSS